MDNQYQKTVQQLWKGVNATIRSIGRKDRLFSLNPKKTALLVVDMQEGFCSHNGCLENPEARNIVHNINRIAKVCREKDIPVVWIRFLVRSHNANAGLWPQFQPASPYSGRKNPTNEFSEKGSENVIWKNLHIDKEKDFEVIKNRYSAFISGSSDLERLLRTLEKDIIIITGVGTNVCCESTARDAMMLDFQVIVVSDGNATVGNIFHEISLMNIKLFFGDVVNTEDILTELTER